MADCRRYKSGSNDWQKQIFFLLLIKYADVFDVSNERDGPYQKAETLTGNVVPVWQQVQ